jgi:hypothetical protein
VARYYFVHKTCHSRTPPYLAKHRSRAETRKPEI